MQMHLDVGELCHKKWVKDFTPAPGNGRNSEGAFCDMDDGRIAFVYSRYRESIDDDCQCDLAVCFSQDGGDSFGESRVIFTCEDCGGSNIMSVSLLPMKNGEIGVFYLKKTKEGLCRMFWRSTRDFVSFSEEIQCIREENYYVVNNDRVVRLENGDILIPAARTPVLGVHSGSLSAVACIYRSRDEGKTFQLISETEMPYRRFTTGLQEPGLLELSPGNLVAVYRNNSGRQYIAFSHDGGETFTTPEPSRFTSPVSPLCMKKLKDGRVLIVYNPVPLFFGRREVIRGAWTGGRTPLVLSLCRSDLDDEYKTLLLENDPESGYCYTAIHEREDCVLLAYCAGSTDDGNTLKRLRIVKIPKELL